MVMMCNSNSRSKPSLRWLVFGSSTYLSVRHAASILAALSSSLVWNRYSFSPALPPAGSVNAGTLCGSDRSRDTLFAPAAASSVWSRCRSAWFAVLVCAVLIPVSGCSWLDARLAGSSGQAALHTVRARERSFAAALTYLRGGREQAARELFEQAVQGEPLSGITDEALFRLALLLLRQERGDIRARELLRRLRNEYPGSIWAHQAAPVEEYLAGLGERRREAKLLKDLNLSLSRDNRELRQSIERLKSLDLELEKKVKR